MSVRFPAISARKTVPQSLPYFFHSRVLPNFLIPRDQGQAPFHRLGDDDAVKGIVVNMFQYRGPFAVRCGDGQYINFAFPALFFKLVKGDS